MSDLLVGQSVRRSEDDRFIIGAGKFVDDVVLAHQSYAFMVRSPHAHARIVEISFEDAAQAPGVLGVFTIEDLDVDGVGNMPCMSPIENRDGTQRADVPRPVLARGAVRYVGEIVAIVIAETYAQAKDAGDLVFVDYEELDAVGTLEAADKDGAPLVWDDVAGNQCFDWACGDEAATTAAFEKAAHITKLDLVNNRVLAHPMEGRAAVAEYSPENDLYTLYATSQNPHILSAQLAMFIMNVPRESFRVITPDLGGGFGMKLYPYPEYALVPWAAKRVGRSVKWVADRSEGFMSDLHGRDLVNHAELALDGDAKILGVRIRGMANMGAYLSVSGPMITTTVGTKLLDGVYRTPAQYCGVRGMFTNTAPLDAYRGAGRPEWIYMLERLLDAAARELGLTQDEIRRRNYVTPEEMPYSTIMDLVVDSGEYERNMDDCMKLADWSGIAARKAEAVSRGKYRGIGLSYYFETTGGSEKESARIDMTRPDHVKVFMGTQTSGQGHETSFAQLLGDQLGVAFDAISVVQGDTADLRQGGGTGGSRSMELGGTALMQAAEKVIEKGRAVAAHMLEAAVEDIEFASGEFAISGTNRTCDLMSVARTAMDPSLLTPALIEQLEGKGLSDQAQFKREAPGFPNGCHVAEVEIDPDTGTVDLVNYCAVNDYGPIINPMIVEGQVHGGVAQGLGQALMEHCIYDPDTAQLLTGSFTDYCIPRADNLPNIKTATNEVRSRTNALGIKGCGESGTTGALATPIHAILDALADIGVEHVDMPATSEKIWQAINISK